MGKGFVFKSGIQVSLHAGSCKRVTALLLIKLCVYIPFYSDCLKQLPLGFRLNIMLLFPRCVCSLEKLMVSELFKFCLNFNEIAFGR